MKDYDKWKLASPEDEERNECPSCGGTMTNHQKKKFGGYCSRYCEYE